MNNLDIIDLIVLYEAEANHRVKLLRDSLGYSDLLRAFVSREVAQSGIIGEMSFEFHGVGCRTTRNNIELDFEFGPNGRVDGIDGWRLAQFASSLGDRFIKYSNAKLLSDRLKILVQDGELTAPGWQPSPNLYYRNIVPPSTS
ncbi:hypothetical protein GCM10008956_10310 [Deinococcus arenae]|uniref:DUF6896 domain-containing protein n=1 Tax=Deinococcus arenae TaxID=1452751 RepID=A0A8H9GKU9_9DEIO|nr:hypothetical protein [Deinococcus arenae]GGM35725.1 hypothetical protein GCM10008956_10310 [Deinococcus arenae]